MLFLSLLGTDATADEPPVSDCVVVEAPPLADLDWVRNEDEILQPSLAITTPAMPELSYWLSFTVRFGSLACMWKQGPLTLEAKESALIDFTIPEECALSKLQSTYLSDLVPTIIGTGADGDTMLEEPGPPVKLLWSDGERRFAMYDLDEAARVAPFGTTNDISTAFTELDVDVTKYAALDIGPGL